MPGPPRGFPGPWPGLTALPGEDLTPKVFTVNPNAGRISGGLSITITGQYFRNNNDGTAPTVKLGTIVATSVIVVDPRTITAVTGVATKGGLVDVTVTVAGITGTLFGGFTYFASTILSVTPAYGDVAGGTAVVVAGFNFVAGSQVTFDGIAATNVVYHDSNTITCKTPAHSTAAFVDVVVTEPA